MNQTVSINTASTPQGEARGRVLTMSSREIAELTGKRHADVMRDIRKMLTDMDDLRGLSKFAHTYRDPQNGQLYPIFALPKRETLILVSG